MTRIGRSALIAFAVLTMVAPAHAGSIPPAQGEVIDPVLWEKLGEGLPSLDVIVRFQGKLTEADRLEMSACGLEVRHAFSVLPAVRALGPPEAVLRLSQYRRVAWMEHNERLELFMDQSLLTINATRTWDTGVLLPSGSQASSIDGTGVTAVVLDSGIDAGHPDLDYGQKTILNLKSDKNLVWTELENSDTSSGHGTHCAGTVAGNGEASGGARSGVARGARLIGLSTGEATAILNAVGALEWVYEHSRPGNNPHNIRVVSNSWGTTSEYDHEDAIVQVSEKLTYDNNVVVVFAAGNEGSNDHNGSTRTTNPYSLPPSVISVAATSRDGSGMASFSSRGLATDNFTWPDIAAPGVNIWSTQARRTLITAMRTQDGDMYYMAISGTSMATPHVSGVVALLWQACPSLKVSDLRDDYSGQGQYDNESYWSDPATRMHEAEVMLKLSSDYIDPTEDNGVPQNRTRGLQDRHEDFAQGYGLVNVHRAVGLALALEKLRREDPEATVLDAYRSYTGMFVERKVSRNTNALEATWHGEWARFDGSNGSVTYTSQVRQLYIPPGASRLILEMQYVAVNLKERYVGTLGLRADLDGDGTMDFSGSSTPTTTGTRREELALGGGDIYIGVDVFGNGFALKFKPLPLPNPNQAQYWELMMEYAVTATLVFDSQPNGTLAHADYDPRVVPWTFGDRTSGSGAVNLSMEKPFYDLSKVVLPKPGGRPAIPSPGIQWWLAGVVAVVVALGLGYKQAQKRGWDKKYLDPLKWWKRLRGK